MMQKNLFGESENLNRQNETELILSKTMSNKSKAKVNFQKALEKNKQLQSKLNYVKDLVVFCNATIGALMPKAEEELDSAYLLELKKLDEAYNNRLFKFTTKRKGKLKEIIFDKAYDAYEEMHIQEAKDYMIKYKPDHYDNELDMMKEEFKSKMKQDFDIDLEPDDFVDGEPDFEKLNEKYSEQFEAHQQEMNDRFNSFGQNRKKTKKELALEEKRKADEKLLEMDVQMLFKELVRKLHPDKELDEATKLEKEKLLQLVNHARDEDDIYELLRVRMMLSENDASMQELILKDDTLVRLTKLVYEKNRMIEGEVFSLHRNSMGLNRMPTIQMNEGKMKKGIVHVIEQEKRNFEIESKSLKKIIETVTSSNKIINEFIDAYRFEEDFDEEIDMQDFFEGLDFLMNMDKRR